MGRTIAVIAGIAWVLAAALAAPDTAAAAAAGLIGSWQCGGSSLVFKSDSVLVYDSEQLRYKKMRNVLRVQQDYGSVDYPFALSGDRLDVTFPDRSVLRCSRATTGAGRPPAGGAKPSGSAAQLRGMLCRWSGSSGMSGGYSSSTRVWFDGAGKFSTRTESSFSGSAGSGYGSGPGGGGTYRVSGDTVHLTFGDGSTGTAKVNMRQTDGRITELMFNGQLYATGLCE
jgi:hypothetical protein